MKNDPNAPAMPRYLGKYKIIGVLGKGSMGVVYKGLDPDIGKLVAIKTMNQKILEDPEMQERFYREGHILGHLQHQNIIHVYNVGVDGETCYIAMEFLDGTCLERMIQEGKKLSSKEVVYIIKQVCEAVFAAHQQNIIHRDLKPANIFLLEGDHVKVLDFGVAHFQNSQLTNSGVLIGTINYIAPEQITGLRVDHRVDIFSIGVILYELLSRKNPFLGNNISQTMLRIINTEPPEIQGIPSSLQRVVNRALAKDRDQRFSSCRDMAEDLKRVLRSGDLDEEAEDTLASKVDFSNEIQAAQKAYLERVLAKKFDAVDRCIKSGDLKTAEKLVRDLRHQAPDSERIRDYQGKLKALEKKQEEKQKFILQLTHETLLKAHRCMADRQYVRAIELCEAVLKEDPKHQDARVIKASCLRKLRRFLDKFGEEHSIG